MSSNTSNISIASKIDKILDQMDKGETDSTQLNQEEKEALRNFAKNLVAFKRMRKSVLYVLVIIAVARSQWDSAQEWLVKALGGD